MEWPRSSYRLPKDESALKIFLKLKGEETGPYSIETLQGWVKAGHIELNDSARIDDAKDWIKVKDIPGINEVVSGHLLNDELTPPFEAYRGDDPYIFVRANRSKR